MGFLAIKSWSSQHLTCPLPWHDSKQISWDFYPTTSTHDISNKYFQRVSGFCAFTKINAWLIVTTKGNKCANVRVRQVNLICSHSCTFALGSRLLCDLIVFRNRLAPASLRVCKTQCSCSFSVLLGAACRQTWRIWKHLNTTHSACLQTFGWTCATHPTTLVSCSASAESSQWVGQAKAMYVSWHMRVLRSVSVQCSASWGPKPFEILYRVVKNYSHYSDQYML